ncbi:MAG: TIGR02452 family protein [Alphaproteobacteria bacterium]|nr:TIGR02452 family protein [Alphaproteobacteria bacterium]
MYLRKYTLVIMALLISLSIPSFGSSPFNSAKTSAKDALNQWNVGKSDSYEILNFLDTLADQIASDAANRDKNIQIFNTTVSTGLKKGLDLNASSKRRNRLYEIIVNKVAPFVTDAHIWESHRILNPTATPASNQSKNQWRLLKRIYRQVNDPRFFGNYWTDAEKKKFQDDRSIKYHKGNPNAYYAPKAYSRSVAQDVLNEAGAGASYPGQKFYITLTGKKIQFPAFAPSYRVEVKPQTPNLTITRDSMKNITNIESTVSVIDYKVTHPGTAPTDPIENKQIAVNPLVNNSTVRLLYVDTYEAAYEMALENPSHDGKVAVVNFANEIGIGGGFLDGAGAQEEELCRRSDLFNQLMAYAGTDAKGKATTGYATRIPIYSSIASPIVTVYKARDFTNLETPYHVQVITSAADRLDRGISTYDDLLKTDNVTNETIQRTYIKILSQIASAVDMGAKVFVTGAFGAGAFNQNPEIIADLYALALQKFGGHFDKIVFAIINPYRWNNYKIFDKRLAQRLPGIQIYDAPEPQTFFVPESTKNGNITSNGDLNPALNLDAARTLAREKMERKIDQHKTY